ncbi:hypothetical protein PIB30_060015 [Stylosanthes scabra]|uniref:Uncharacterized protein n=1 Tax=Stylosanthes scabra TaxID=79078 RepID=A0ABU6XIB7_9FABA|nr:hypothetical protein [Stylosanthes scabra]
MRIVVHGSDQIRRICGKISRTHKTHLLRSHFTPLQTPSLVSPSLISVITNRSSSSYCRHLRFATAVLVRVASALAQTGRHRLVPSLLVTISATSLDIVLLVAASLIVTSLLLVASRDS